MKMEIWDESEELQEQVVRLRLREGGHGIDLCVVDERGENIMNGIVLRITNSGKMYRYHGLAPCLGLEIDPDSSNSRIRETDA